MKMEESHQLVRDLRVEPLVFHVQGNIFLSDVV